MKTTSYDPLIYPRKLWVVTDPIETELNELFGFFDYNGSETKCDIDLIKENLGSCCLCYEKSTGCKGVVVIINDFGVSTIAHESVHVADGIFDDLGMVAQNFTQGGNEPYAHLVGWVAKCIEEGTNQ